MKKYRELSKIFNIKFIKKIIKNQHQELLDEYTNEIKNLRRINESGNLKKLYIEAYKVLLDNYRMEYIYKNELYFYICKKYDIIKGDAVVTELRAGRNVADFVFFNGTSKVYEIKTEMDRNSRLLSQVKSYSELFKEVYVVTNSRNIEPVKKLLPEHVGLLEFNDNNEFHLIKEADEHFINLKHITMFNTLRRKEYENIIKEYYSVELNITDDKIYDYCCTEFQKIPVLDAHDLVVAQLKKRASKELLKSSKKWIKPLSFLVENSNLTIKEQEELQKIFN